MTVLPKFLYHGTSAANLDAILRDGLVPRSRGGASQWEHTVESRADAVYLTTAYPLYFAINASKGADLLIVEIDVRALDVARLIADEDSLALTGKQSSRSTMARAAHYREHSHNHSAVDSLGQLGTCAHLGVIDPSTIARVARIKAESTGHLVLGGFDPIISPINFMIFGAEYTASVPWLFGDVESCAINPRLTRPEIEITEFRKT